MADDHKDEGGIPETLIFLVGLLAVLGALWWVRGGPALNGEGEGIFIAPLPPVGSGETFGPEFNETQPQE